MSEQSQAVMVMSSKKALASLGREPAVRSQAGVSIYLKPGPVFASMSSQAKTRTVTLFLCACHRQKPVLTMTFYVLST